MSGKNINFAKPYGMGRRKRRWWENRWVFIRYARRSRVGIGTWRYGLQFDVQTDMVRGTRGGYSFRGHLWCWDVRRPLRITRQD